MAAKKKELLIEYELEFLDGKLQELKRYIQDRPFHELKDRIEWRPTKTGVMPMVVATVEAQRKDLTSAIKEYAEITQVVDKMREAEKAKELDVYGDHSLSPFEKGELDKDED
jgi:hypothetical protein